jgi:hypothetical protein
LNPQLDHTKYLIFKEVPGISISFASSKENMSFSMPQAYSLSTLFLQTTRELSRCLETEFPLNDPVQYFVPSGLQGLSL